MFVQTNVAQNICAKIVDFFGISIFLINLLPA